MMSSLPYLLVLMLISPLLCLAGRTATDPCTKVAGRTFMPPADALACQKSFPFDETLSQNVLTNVARVFDFFTFEDYYLRSPPPFQESTVNIIAALAKINNTRYTTDYDFNIDLFDFTTQLNDGHTRWFPNCYTSFQNILPAPFVTIEEDGKQGVYIAFDSVELLTQLGPQFTDYFDSINFDWKRLAGAKVVQIEGQDPYEYADHIATTVSGNYLDHGVRVNSVFSSYRIAGTTFAQRVGDLAGPIGVAQTSLTLKLIPVNSTRVETTTIPYLTNFAGIPFTDGVSFWANNCLANEFTNGVDLKSLVEPPRRLAKANIIDKSNMSAVNLPPAFQPTLPPVAGSGGVIKSHILPDKKTGVMFVGSFEGDFDGFQSDTVAAINSFKTAGVTQLLTDLTNNGGGFICLGHFLHQYLAGLDFGYPGFVSTIRANPLAQKVIAGYIKFGLNEVVSFYTDAFLNGTQMAADFNYIDPSAPFVVNGRSDPTSQRFHDSCGRLFSQPIPATPPFDLKKVAIVTATIAVFGGKPGGRMEFKGMAGNQVFEWTDLDTEIKTQDPLAPPDLLVSGNFRHNWRTAWSFLDERVPIAYLSELPLLRFPYTKNTYINPQNLWTFAATKLFA